MSREGGSMLELSVIRELGDDELESKTKRMVETKRDYYNIR